MFKNSKVTPHFSLKEVNKTDTAWQKDPQKVARVGALAYSVLEPLRQKIGPIQINSWYRTKQQNDACGGHPNSRHMLGAAADIKPLDMSLEETFNAISAMNLPFHKCALYPTFIHVEINESGGAPERKLYKVENGKWKRWG